MGKAKRVDWFFENHIGLGIRWNDYGFPFITVTIGIGTAKHKDL